MICDPIRRSGDRRGGSGDVDEQSGLEELHCDRDGQVVVDVLRVDLVSWTGDWRSLIYDF